MVWGGFGHVRLRSFGFVPKVDTPSLMTSPLVTFMRVRYEPRGGNVFRKLTIASLIILTACATATKSRGLVAGSGRSAGELYERGLSFMQKGNYERALEEFQELRNFHRDDPLSVKAQLALADIRFERGEYEEARYAYEEFATYHPRHESLDHVTFQIGYAIWKRAPKLAGRDQSTTKAALGAWSSFSSRFPTSDYLPKVEQLEERGMNRLASKSIWIARFYKKQDAWRSVRGRSQEVLRLYPTSKYIEEALALMAISEHHLGNEATSNAALQELEEDHPSSRFLAEVKRELKKEPSATGEDPTFLRPYRIPSGAGPQGGMGQPPQ